MEKRDRKKRNFLQKKKKKRREGEKGGRECFATKRARGDSAELTSRDVGHTSMD